MGYPNMMGAGELHITTATEDPVVKLRKKRERLMIKAQATAWALYYYLAKDHPSELRRFVSELAAMPRDLPLDGATVLAAFDKAFGLDGSKESHQKFADRWLSAMGSLAPAGFDIPLVDPKPASKTDSPGNPGLPGMPLGPMPPGPNSRD